MADAARHRMKNHRGAKIRVYPALTIVLMATMLRALSSLGCPEFTLDQTLALAAKHGLDGVELRALGGTVELPAYFIQHFGTPEALTERVKATTFRPLAFTRSVSASGVPK